MRCRPSRRARRRLRPARRETEEEAFSRRERARPEARKEQYPMAHLNLEAVDATAQSARPPTSLRRHPPSSCARARLAGGAALSGGAILSALSGCRAGQAKGAPPSSFGKGDIGILNYALTLEYLESAFYNAAAKNGVAKGDKQLTAFLNDRHGGRERARHAAQEGARLEGRQGAEVRLRQGRHQQEHVRRDGVRAGEHRRARLPRAGRQHLEPGVPAGRARRS